MVDPEFEIDHTFVPVIRDPVTKHIRQLSSAATVLFAKGAFHGYVTSAAYPRGSGSAANGNLNADFGQKIKVYRVGEVEIELNAPTDVTLGDEFDPVLVGGNVSNHIWTRVGPAGTGGILRVERMEDFPSYIEDPCSTSAAPTDVSPTAPLGAKRVSRVFATFNTRFTSNP